MEINEPLDSEIHNLEITPISRGYLLQAAKWGRFVSIVGFVFLGLFVLAFLLSGVNMMTTEISEEFGIPSSVGSIAIFIYIGLMLSLIHISEPTRPY